MNVSKSINKLLFALKQKGQLYKINSFQFYSEKNDKYSTKYQVLKRKFVKEYDIEEEEEIIKEKYEQDYDCYSKVDLLKYLIEEHEKGSEADE